MDKKQSGAFLWPTVYKCYGSRSESVLKVSQPALVFPNDIAYTSSL